MQICESLGNFNTSHIKKLHLSSFLWIDLSALLNSKIQVQMYFCKVVVAVL